MINCEKFGVSIVYNTIILINYNYENIHNRQQHGCSRCFSQVPFHKSRNNSSAELTAQVWTLYPTRLLGCSYFLVGEGTCSDLFFQVWPDWLPPAVLLISVLKFAVCVFLFLSHPSCPAGLILVHKWNQLHSQNTDDMWLFTNRYSSWYLLLPRRFEIVLGG